MFSSNLGLIDYNVWKTNLEMWIEMASVIHTIAM